jgi:hypothetical protein
MRRLSLILLALFALTAAAQNPPSKLEPIPEPPPPPGVADETLEPQVTITKRGEDKVEEYRLNGKLYMLKVTPPHGVPYYLIDQQGTGSWIRHDAMSTDLSVPMWVIGTF